MSDKPKILTKVSLFFFSHKIFTISLMIALVLFGTLSYFVLLRREGFPPVSIPIVVTNGTYFANDSKIVDEKVAKPLSDVISEVDGVKTVQTTADANFYTVITTLDEGVASEEGQDRIKAAIDSQANLPAEATVDFLNIKPAKFLGQHDMVVSVYSLEDNAEVRAMEKQATQLAEEITKTEEVAKAEVLPLTSKGRDPRTGQEVEQQTSFGRFSPETDGAVSNFYDSVLIGIEGNTGEELDIFKLSSSVQKKVDELNSQLEAQDSDFRVAISSDFSTSVSNQIASLQENVVTGLLIISVITLLLISWRVSIMSAIFMVTVILITTAILYLLGYTLNTITLFALVLALGLYVDDATIVGESLHAAKSSKLTKKQMLIKAINSVGLASTSGSLTTMLVFVPLLFVSGIIGSFIFLLPLTVIISLIVSLILSLTFIPFMSQYAVMSKAELAKKPRSNPVAKAIYSSIMLLKTKRTAGIVVAGFMLLMSLGFLMGSGYFATKLSFNIFPSSSDSDQILVTAMFKEGTELSQAEDISDQINEIVTNELGDNLVAAVYGANQMPSNRSADMLVELTPFRDREATSVELVSTLEQRLNDIEGARITVGQVDAGPPADDFPFKTQIYTEDSAAATKLAVDITRYLDGHEFELLNGDKLKIVRTSTDYTQQTVRKDGRQYIQVSAGFDNQNISEALQTIQSSVEEEFDQEKLKTYGLEAQTLGFNFGQESENADSFSSLGLAGLLAFGLILLVLVVQFRSLTLPLLIFVAMPFSLLGVTAGLYFTDNALSFFSMVGFIGLIGVAVNNAILLTDYARQQRQKGESIISSIALASRDRFRPQVTTTATTVAALAPLAFFDPFWEPLATTILFGLISSTFLILTAFPYYYIAIESSRSYFKGKLLVKWWAGLIITVAIGYLIGSLISNGAVLALLIALYILGSVLLAIYRKSIGSQTKSKKRVKA